VAKSAGDAIANGDNFDLTFTIVVENLGNVSLNNLTLFDDVMASFGAALTNVQSPSIANFSGTGTTPTINETWLTNTAQNILVGGQLDPGDSFEVVFTVTLDPDASGSSGSLTNEADASGQGVNPDGTVLTDNNGAPIFVQDDSDNGTDPSGENANDNMDGIPDNDPTPIVIADLSIAKSVVGEPELTELGNFVVTYQLVVENTGTVDLGSLSLLEDLASQFGSAFVNAGNLNLIDAPNSIDSSISLNSTGFNGEAVIELTDALASNILVAGDSFSIAFDVEIDPRAVTDPLENQVNGSAGAVDENGNPILDSTGNPITTEDVSDSGSDPGSSNPNAPGDQGTTDDTTPFDPPAVPLSEIAGTVFIDNNNDGLQQPGEAGIAGVEITLTGTDVFGNPVNITTTTDSSGRYVFAGLNAGTYALTQTQPEGFEDGIDNGNPAQTVENDMISNIQLGFGEILDESTFAERLEGASGNPPGLQGLPPTASSPISNLLSSFLSRPSTIYSGTPINANANPLSLDSGRVVTGGYSADGLAGDCGCPEPINPCCQPVDPCGQPTKEVTVTDSVQPHSLDSVAESKTTSVDGFIDVDGEPSEECSEAGLAGQVIVEDAACDPIFDMAEPCACKPGFLKRFANWLRVQ